MRHSPVRIASVIVCCIVCVHTYQAGDSTGSAATRAAESNAIDEFRARWAALGSGADYGPDEYRQLLQDTREMIVPLGALGADSHRLFIELLQQENRSVGAGMSMRMPDTQLKPLMMEVLADHDVPAAVPVLERFVALEDSRLLEATGPDRRARDDYRALANPAARALGNLGDRSVIPTLRATFGEVFAVMPRGAALMHSLPEALLQLGDGAYLEELFIRFIEGLQCAEASDAAYLASKLTGQRVIPHLIVYLRQTNDRGAQWSLERITGREYLGADAWDAWWNSNRERPRRDWQDLYPAAAWRGEWIEMLIETIEERYLSVNYLLWSARERPHTGHWKAASLDLVRKAYELEIEDAIVAHLETRSKDESSTLNCVEGYSCGRAVKGVAMKAKSPSPNHHVRRPVRAVTRDGKSHSGLGVCLACGPRSTVADNAKLLLEAFSCVADDPAAVESDCPRVARDAEAPSGLTMKP